MARDALQHWMKKEYSVEKVNKFIGKVNNAFEYFFTFIIHANCEEQIQKI